MGIGGGIKVKVISVGEQTGVDGVEPLNEEIANVWAEVDYVKQSKNFTANKEGISTNYVLLIRCDTAYDINIRNLIEINNHFSKIVTVDRGRKGKGKGTAGYSFISNPTGLYWRIETTAQDIR